MEQTWTTPEDVKDRWLSSEEIPPDKLINMWIGDAEIYVMSEIDGLHEQLTDDPDGIWRKRFVAVISQLVTSILTNPDRIRQRSTTAGVFATSETLGTESLTSELQLSSIQRALLTPKGKKKHFGLDMTPTRATDSHPLATSWVNGPDNLAPTTEETPS